ELPTEVFVPEVEDVAAPEREREPEPAPEPEPEPQPEREQPSPRADGVSPGAPTDAEIRAELEALYGKGAAGASDGGGDGASGLSRSVMLVGPHAKAPPDAPQAVQRIVAAANQVATLPYVYGGGHGRAEGLFVDTAYDCSGSISFALANAGLMDRPMTSGEMMSWGEPGQGEWVTIYANEGHAFMVVGGARFDTVGLRETGSRWQEPFRTVSGFTAVHPPGL
ncbi:MAG TPA: hypothetical protein VIL49_08700, partial [Capillimicrobium sp.]